VTEFGHLLGTLEPYVHQYGAAAVFLILTFESFGAPLPGESLLIVASILAGRGDISHPALILSAWAGSVVGDSIGYRIGRRLGRALLQRHGGKVGLTAERLVKVEAVFARYGPAAVAFARFFDVLRQLNGVVAGSMDMPWRRFVLFNALGAALWVLTWTAVGYYVGLHGTGIAAFMHRFGYAGIALALIAAVVVLAYLYRRRADLAQRPER
jgi:membrane protein DedA with SNARE-associated domain